VSTEAGQVQSASISAGDARRPAGPNSVRLFEQDTLAGSRPDCRRPLPRISQLRARDRLRGPALVRALGPGAPVAEDLRVRSEHPRGAGAVEREATIWEDPGHQADPAAAATKTGDGLLFT
jgi:hypothetical protein